LLYIMPQGKTVKDWRKLARAQFQEGLEDDSSTSSSRPITAEDVSSWSGLFLKRPRRGDATSVARTNGVERFLAPKLDTIVSSDEDINESGLHFEKRKLYGREKDIELLMQEFPTTERSVILVSGESGVGKSALVDKLESPVNQAGGLYVRGKYDSLFPPAPYSGITAACTGICEHLLENKPTSEQLTQLRSVLGSSIHMLFNLLPSLLDLIDLGSGKEDSSKGAVMSEARVSEAQNRFVYAVKSFLRVIAGWRPIVMVLDDLQWADKESFGLLECIMSDPQLKQFILVGCYRSNEVDEYHSLSIWRRVMESTNDRLRFTSLEISNLQMEAVNEMLADVLALDTETTTELSGMVHQKTHGNACFTIQFLNMLSEQNMLEFSSDSGKPAWDTRELETRTKATENVIDLIREKMQKLPDEVGEVLPLAACLGSSFTARTLSAVVEVFHEERHFQRSHVSEEKSGTKQWLGTCIRIGFIEKVRKGKYAWVHDKFKEAALALLVPRKLREVQFRVGEVLIRHLSQREISENIFVVTNLLNQGFETKFEDIVDPLQIARLNLEAGEAAMACASFAQAAVHLQTGIKHLSPNHWTTDYSLSLDLFSSAAEAEYCIGDAASAEERCDIILEQNRPVTDKVRAYNVLIPLVGNQNNVHGACEILVEVLKELGCTFPRFGQRLTVMRGVLKLQSDTKKHSPEDFANHKTITDPEKIYALGMLDKLATFSYFTNTLHLPMSILKSFQWTVQYGTTEYSPVAFALGGLTLCVQLKDYEGGRRLAECGLAVLEANPEYEATEARTIFLAHAFCIHHMAPLQLSLEPFLRGYSTGMEVGDVESAFWNAYVHLDFSFYLGKNLVEMEHDYESYMSQLKPFREFRQHTFMAYQRQVVQCLQGKCNDPLILKGEHFDADSFEVEDKHQIGVIRFRQHDLAAFMCDDETCAELSCMMKRDFDPDELSPGTNACNFVEAHSAIACFGAARKTKDKSYVSVGRKCQKHIKDLSKKGSENFLHVEYLIEAEAAALKGQKDTAIQNYESSISAASKKGMVNYQGIAHERFADYLSECGELNDAENHWNKALYFYRVWAANAKIEQVTEKKKLSPIKPIPEI